MPPQTYNLHQISLAYIHTHTYWHTSPISDSFIILLILIWMDDRHKQIHKNINQLVLNSPHTHCKIEDLVASCATPEITQLPWGITQLIGKGLNGDIALVTLPPPSPEKIYKDFIRNVILEFTFFKTKFCKCKIRWCCLQKKAKLYEWYHITYIFWIKLFPMLHRETVTFWQQC